MNKRCLAGMIAAIVLGVVLVAGCTSPTTTSPTPSPAPSTTTSAAAARDPFLNSLVISMERELANNITVSSWVERWENGTTVSIQAQYNGVSLNRTVIRFASIDAATAYANNITAGYVITTNVTKAVSLPYRAYQLTKGSPPTVYIAWTKIDFQPPGTSTIQQIDDTVIVDMVSAS